MNQYNPMMGTPMTAKQYAEQWSNNSVHFKENGSYDWMSQNLNNSENILELGCGAGFSSLSIIQSGCKKLLVIETNGNLANATKNLLEDNGISVSLSHFDNSNADDLITDKTVDIILGNVYDEDVKGFVSKLEVDCIVCWFIGADPTTVAESLNKPVINLTREDMALYRQNTHRGCYQLAERILKPSGVISIVDRGGLPDVSMISEAQNYLEEVHEELSGGKFCTERVEIKLLNESFETSKIQYVAEIENQVMHPMLNSIQMKKR